MNDRLFDVTTLPRSTPILTRPARGYTREPWPSGDSDIISEN